MSSVCVDVTSGGESSTSARSLNGTIGHVLDWIGLSSATIVRTVLRASSEARPSASVTTTSAPESFELVSKKLSLQPRAERHFDCAKSCACEDEVDGFGSIGLDDRYPVSVPHPKLGEAGGDQVA